jgi:hypothetical protein
VGFIPDVVPDTPILSAGWGNLIRDRTVMDFANAAERASQWVSPPEGAQSYLRDIDRIEHWNGNAWVHGGEIARALMTADQLLTGAPFDILALDATFTAVPGHVYRTNLLLPVVVNHHSADNYAFFAINDGASRTTLLREGAISINAAQQMVFAVSLRESGLSGTVVRGCRFQGAVVNNLSVLGATPSQAGELWVTDVTN